jgi:hypothetical protein
MGVFKFSAFLDHPQERTEGSWSPAAADFFIDNIPLKDHSIGAF